VPDLEPVRRPPAEDAAGGDAAAPGPPVAVVRSDAQNVHDSVLVRHVKAALDQMPLPDSSSLPEQLRGVREFLGGSEEEKYREALGVVDKIESNPASVTSLDMTEAEVLGRVWHATDVPGDADQTRLRREMLVERLSEVSREGSCTSGRVARIVDSLSTFDDRVALKPTWAIRQELLGRASVIAASHDGEAAGGRPLRDVLRQVFHEEYVVPGLIPARLVEAELDDWGDAL
jgi:hypothetical protein